MTSTSPGRPVGRHLRHTGWWVFGALVVASLAFLLISEAIGWRYLRGPIQTQAAKRLGVEVRLSEPFELRLLRPPEVSLGGLWIAAAPGSDAPFLVDARELRLAWRWADVWALRSGDALRVKALEAGTLEAHLRRPEKGVASWGFKLGDKKPADAQPEWPRFDLLQLRSGQLHIDDEPLALKLEARFDVSETRTARSMPLPTTDTGAELSHAVLTMTAAAPSATGFHFDARGTYRELPTRLSLKSPQVLPFLASGGTPPVQVEARASVGRAQMAYDGTLTDLLGERGIDGSFVLNGPSLGAVGEPLDVTLPSTPPFSLRGRLTKNDPVWRVAVASGTVGRSQLAGEFAYDPQPAVPRLTGSLRGKRLALDDLAPAVGASGAAAAKPAPNKEAPEARAKPRRVLPQRSFDLPSLVAMDADVQVALDELDLDTSALDPLRPLKGRVRLEAGVLRIDDIDARTAGGSVSGSTRLDSTTSPPRWQADLRWSGVDLAGWLRGARKDSSTVKSTTAPAKLKRERAEARSGEAPVTAYVTGELRGSARLSGQGRSTAEILGSLDGEAQAIVRDGTVSHLVVELLGIDIAQSLGVWVKGDDSLPLNCAAVVMDAKKGVLTPRVAVIDTSDTTVVISGSVDLAQEGLDLRSVARPRDFSFVALRSPARVQGTFAAPRVSVEAGPIATRLVASAALALVNPLAALIPLFDPGDDAGDGCRALASNAKASASR